jgi:ATP/maltotriose-dependent transcriptional regulator MalT
VILGHSNYSSALADSQQEPALDASSAWTFRRTLILGWRALLAMKMSESLYFAIRLEQLAGGGAPPGTQAPLKAAASLFRAAILAVQDDWPAAAGCALQAQQADPFARRAIAIGMTIRRLGHWRAGNLSQFHALGRAPATQQSRKREALPAIFDLCLEAAVQFGKLRPVVAGRLAIDALELARASVGGDSPAALLPATLVAQVAYERGEFEEAESLIRYRMTAIRTSGTIECASRAYRLLARIAAHRRQCDGALAILRDAQALAERRGWTRMLADVLAERIRLLLDEGETGKAHSCLHTLEAFEKRQREANAPELPDDVQTRFEISRLRLATGRDGGRETSAAIGLLSRAAAARSDLYLSLELRLQLAAARAAGGDTHEATEILTRCLHVGAANGLWMIFVDAGPIVRELLRKLCHDVHTTDERVLELHAYINTLLANSPDRAAKQTTPPNRVNTVNQTLSRRETGILRLMAKGMSNKQIAHRLDIAPETVKSHAKSIFVKLVAQTRAQAVAHAETLSLI